jgi:hypothetical protein
LVTSIGRGTIYARRITTQDDLRFDRQTGIEMADSHSRIDCIVPFPPNIHEIFLELDRKYRVFRERDRNGVELDVEQCKLTPEEKRALLFIDEHISPNLI